MDITEEVRRLRDNEHWPFQRIADNFNVSRGLVDRAYQAGRTESTKAGAGPQVAAHKRVPHIAKHQLEIVRQHADSDLTTAEISRLADLPHNTTARYRRKFLNEAA